jgi:hypothetical protein
MFLLFAAVALAADPVISGGPGLGLTIGGVVGPTLDGQVQVHGLVDDIPVFGVGDAALATFGKPCDSCSAGNMQRIGFGGGYRTPFADFMLMGRLVRFDFGSSFVNFQPAIEVSTRIGIGPVELQPYLGLAGLNNIDAGTGVRVVVGNDDPAIIEIGDDDVTSERCENGTTKWNGAAGEKVWVLPGRVSVDISPTLERAGTELFGDLADILGVASDVFTGGGKYANTVYNAGTLVVGGTAIPAAPIATAGAGVVLAETGLRKGTEWMEANANAIVDVTVTTRRFEVTTVCRPQQICTEGFWEDNGVLVVGESHTVLSPLNFSQGDLAPNEIFAAIRRGRNTVRPLFNAQAAYEANPCEGISAPEPDASGPDSPGIIDDPGGGKNCQPELEAKQAAHAAVDAAREALEGKVATLAEVTARLDARRAQWDEEKRQAAERLATAEQVLQDATKREDDLARNQPLSEHFGGNQAQYQSAWDSWNRSFEAAKAASQAARSEKRAADQANSAIQSYPQDLSDLYTEKYEADDAVETARATLTSARETASEADAAYQACLGQ